MTGCLGPPGPQGNNHQHNQKQKQKNRPTLCISKCTLGEEQLQLRTTDVLVCYHFKAVFVVSRSWYYFGTFFCSRSDFPRSVKITGLFKLSLRSIEQGCFVCCFHFINPHFFLLFFGFILLFWLLEGSA